MNRVDLSIDNSLTFTGLQTNRPSARFASYTQRSDPKLNSESEQFKRGIQYLQKASRHSSSVADRQPERLPKVGKGTLVQLELHGVSAKHSSSQNPPQQKSVSVLAEHPIDEGREPAGYGRIQFNTADVEQKRCKPRIQSSPSTVPLTESKQFLNPHQRFKASRREQLLTSIPMTSNFCLKLREAVSKPARGYPHLASAQSRGKLYRYPSISSATSGRLLPTNVNSVPSLRMRNEGSSYTQYVRMNKSAYGRLDIPTEPRRVRIQI